MSRQWRLAQSLVTFIAQCDAAWPQRSKTADGTIGDARHQQEASGHNPDADDVVAAFDLTHDPKNGADCNIVAAQLAALRDPRDYYMIWNRRIWRSYAHDSHPAHTWADYTGADPHTGHLHLSVGADVHPWQGSHGDPKLYDNPAPWDLAVFGDDVTKDDIKDAIREVLAEELVVVPGEAGQPKGAKRSLLTFATQVWGHVLRTEKKR